MTPLSPSIEPQMDQAEMRQSNLYSKSQLKQKYIFSCAVKRFVYLEDVYLIFC